MPGGVSSPDDARQIPKTIDPEPFVLIDQVAVLVDEPTAERVLVLERLVGETEPIGLILLVKDHDVVDSCHVDAGEERRPIAEVKKSFGMTVGDVGSAIDP